MSSDAQRVVKTYADGSCYYFRHGQKDAWQVVFQSPGGTIKPLHDVDYLRSLKKLGNICGTEKVFQAVQTVFYLVEANAVLRKQKPRESKRDFQVLHELAIDLVKDVKCSRLWTEKLLDCWYLTMMAEWYYQHTVLYHNVKRLAAYQVLMLDMSPEKVATFSKGKRAPDLVKLMKQYHIYTDERMNFG